MADRKIIINALLERIEEAKVRKQDYIKILPLDAKIIVDLLKDQTSLARKMWNEFYAEEDELEKKYVGTNENDNWFLIYRPWLQRGFEIALETIVKQEGR